MITKIITTHRCDSCGKEASTLSEYGCPLPNGWIKLGYFDASQTAPDGPSVGFTYGGGHVCSIECFEDTIALKIIEPFKNQISSPKNSDAESST